MERNGLRTFAYKECKIAALQKFVFRRILPFMVLVLLSASVNRCFVFRMRRDFSLLTPYITCFQSYWTL